MMVPPHDPEPAATAVGVLLAPVVARLRDDDTGFDVLLDGVCRDGDVARVVGAAPAVARVYMRLAPPPDGAAQIVASYADAARDHFERDAVRLGAGCLEVARAEAPVAGIAEAVFVRHALDQGPRVALEGAVASCWWCALRSAGMRGVDPVEETAAILRYVARVA